MSETRKTDEEIRAKIAYFQAKLDRDDYHEGTTRLVDAAILIWLKWTLGE